MKICPTCQAENFDANLICKNCRSQLDGSKQISINLPKPKYDNKNNARNGFLLLAFLGLLLIVGTFFFLANVIYKYITN